MSSPVPGMLDGPLALSLFTVLLTFGATAAIGFVLTTFPALPRLTARVLEFRPGRPSFRLRRGKAIPDHHVAAISAAVTAMIGNHRIVRIESAHHGGWRTEGRTAHHGSHAVFHPGGTQRHQDNEGNRHHGTEIQNQSRRARI